MTCAAVVRELAVTPYDALPCSTAPVRLLHANGAIDDTPTKPAAAIDPDAIDELGDEIATLSAHIHAATHRLLTLIAEFDRLRGWEFDGHRSCAHWLAFRTGNDLGAAREKVRAARALERLPATSAAMSRGELSFSQVRALTRVARPENETDLLELAQGTTTAQLERMIRSWKKGSRREEAATEREHFELRSFCVFPDDDGMYIVRGRLTPEVGALLMRAIDAAGDALYRDRSASRAALDAEQDAAQRHADAVRLLAERTLSAGFGADENAELPGNPAAEVPISGTRAERYQVVLHVEPATLVADADPGRAELEDGTRVSAETCRRIACDASIVRVTHDYGGSVLDVGRRTRTISPALRRALEVRDRGCRFPGCGLRFTDAHHVKHWVDGGETSLANCLLLCGHHHRLVHEGGWRIEWWGAQPMFYGPRGVAHFDGGWRPPTLSERPAEALIAENRRRGIEPDAWTPSARWKREADIPASLYFRTCEV